ncbi:hypothetical protein MMC17_002440 [Xylographa soralifera]|nr:hypothetical protein [Xylographa soralifera]
MANIILQRRDIGDGNGQWGTKWSTDDKNGNDTKEISSKALFDGGWWRIVEKKNPRSDAADSLSYWTVRRRLEDSPGGLACKDILRLCMHGV